MQSKLLATAILGVIATKVVNQESFSAFDITRKVREQVNNGEYAISGQVKEVLENGEIGYRIEHSSVREFVNQLFSYGYIHNYEEKHQTNGACRFKLYQPKASNSVATPQLADASTQISDTPVISYQFGVAPTPDISAAALVAYVDNKLATDGAVTLKQIQSRFKECHYTCADYAEAVIALGYTVTKRPEAFSLSTVNNLTKQSI